MQAQNDRLCVTDFDAQLAVVCPLHLGTAVAALEDPHFAIRSAPGYFDDVAGAEHVCQGTVAILRYSVSDMPGVWRWSIGCLVPAGTTEYQQRCAHADTEQGAQQNGRYNN